MEEGGADGAEANASGPGSGALSAYQAESRETLTAERLKSDVAELKVRISAVLRTSGLFRPVFKVEWAPSSRRVRSRSNPCARFSRWAQPHGGTFALHRKVALNPPPPPFVG